MIFLQFLSMASMLSLPRFAATADTVAASMNAYDVQHYDCSISFDLEKKTLNGTVLITARALQPMHTIILNASHETMTIDSVKLENTRLPFHHEADILNVSLPQEIMAKESITVSVCYNGTSKFNGEYDSGGVYFSSSDHLATISEPNFARTWLPCKDIPSDKATTTMHITVDEKLTAVSNGVLRNTTHRNGMATYTWDTRYPIATYLISIAAAPYKEYSDSYTAMNGEQMKISYYVFSEDSQKATMDFANTSKILGFFARTFCEYPFVNEKFGYAEVDGDLTMENQTICSIQRGTITGNQEFETVIVHETAHQWWGDLITPLNWGDIWLSEGFATYAEALYRESAYSVDSYRRYIAWLMSVKQGDYNGPIVNYNDTAFWSLFSQRVYSKGALVLHMLRGIVGDSMFFSIMRNFLNDNRLRYGNASTEDFIRTCEQTYSSSLRWFFDEWVYASADSIDRPEYEYRWSTLPNGSMFDVRLDLTQTTAAKQLFRMPMTITISTGKSEHNFRITDSLAVQSFNFQLREQPTSVEIDKENYVFKILKKSEDN